MSSLWVSLVSALTSFVALVTRRPVRHWSMGVLIGPIFFRCKFHVVDSLDYLDVFVAFERLETAAWSSGVLFCERLRVWSIPVRLRNGMSRGLTSNRRTDHNHNIYAFLMADGYWLLLDLLVASLRRLDALVTLFPTMKRRTRSIALCILTSLSCSAWILPSPPSSARPAITSRRSLSRSPYWTEAEDEEFLEKYNGEDSTQQSTIYEPETLEWEVCNTDAGTAHVLLPPSAVKLPSVVFHFTGGTFFGSAPNFWYRQLLEDLVRHTQAAIVATSIPLTLNRSPLQHVDLAKKIRKQFHTAYRDVLADEYGQAIQSVPVCGIGHSLGARLMVVLATLDSPNTTTKRSSKVFVPPSYNSSILISFTNNNAVDGIPGLNQLVQASRQSEKAKRDERGGSRRRSRYNDEDDVYDDDDDYNEDDEAFDEIFGELQSLISKQANRIKSALTPSSDELEFFPNPEELLEAHTTGGRYTIRKTLVVQFDNDGVDQSSKLATAIVGSSDVKYARLRGTHLTPISLQSSTSRSSDQLHSRAGMLIGKLLAGSAMKKSDQEAFLELRQSIARYATEVVTKP